MRYQKLAKKAYENRRLLIVLIAAAVFICAGALAQARVEKGRSGARIAGAGCSTFTDALEPTQNAGWTFDAAVIPPDNPSWALTNDPNTTLPTNHSFFSSATTTSGPAGIKDDRVVSPPLDLSATSVLTFSHRYSLEGEFDGGVLEISTDGGTNWTDLEASITAGGYNGTIDPDPVYESPIVGRPAWTGISSGFPDPDGMDQVTVNLGTFAGTGRKIRWRLGLDNLTFGPLSVGWYIDSFQVTNVSCTGATPTPTPTPTATPTATPSPTGTPVAGSGLDLTIDATASDGTVIANETYIDVIKIKNATVTNATNVVLQVVLAPGAVYLGAPTTPDPTSGTGTSGDPLTWNLGTLNAGTTTNIYLYQRSKATTEDPTIVWQLLDTEADLSYTLIDPETREGKTMGPKVVPTGDVGETVRHGKRPFPVAYVEYQDMAHTRPHSIFQTFFEELEDRYMEMSMNQLLPQPSQPSVGRTTTFASTPAERYRFSNVQPAGFCGGATLAEDNNPYDDDTPPPTMTNRILNGWYQLPGTRGYYGSDSTASAYPAFFVPVGLLLNIDNGCGPPGKIAYDAATLMDPDVDYNDFDTDRDGWVDFFELVYQGQPQNILGQTGADNVWPHSSGLQYYYTDGYTSHDRLRDHQDQLLFWTDDSHTTTQLVDNGRPAYVRVGAYNVNAEFSDAITFAHEYGHSLGIPDEYTTAGRNTIDDWSLMASGPGHMGIWAKQELGWIVPTLLTSPRDVTGQKELKFDTQQIEWRDPNGSPYTLTGNVHNAEVYKVDLPKVQLFDPSLIPSGSWVYYSQAGNGFGYPGHVFDIAFDANTTAGSTSLKLQFKSWFEIEKDYDYAYLQVCQLRGVPLSLQCDNLESINDAGEGGPTTGSPADTNPNGTNHGNGMTCSSGASADPSCGVAAYPEPVFITDEFDLTPYAGEDFVVRWAYSTDPGLAFRGWVLDDIELLKNGSTRVFFDDAENPVLSNDDTHAYNGWLRSNGTATQEHAYWIGVRDKTGFDATAGWTPGVTLEYANEAHGYGNAGVDDPPAYTVLDSKPQVGVSDVNLNDAAWTPFPSSPGSTSANNGDIFTDCDDPAYADGPRHVDNYEDPNSSDGNWHFGYQKLKMLVNAMGGMGGPGIMTANVSYTLPAPCANATPTPTPTPTRGIEADVAPRDNPDGQILSNDVTQVRRFVNETDQVNGTANEFQRADTAPRNTNGDGELLASDVVQARRYQNGTDNPAEAAGPVEPSEARSGPTTGTAESMLQVESAKAVAGSQVTLRVVAVNAAAESEFGFVLTYAQNVLSDPVIGAGDAGAAIRACNTSVPGRINCSVGAFPNDRAGSSSPGIGEIGDGKNRALVTVTFRVAGKAPAGETPITLSNVNASNDAAEQLAIGSEDGTVTIIREGKTSSDGRITDSDGRGVSRATIVLTDSAGKTLEVRSNSFGYFDFSDVVAGRTYVATVSSRRFSFAPVTVIGGISEMELTSDP